MNAILGALAGKLVNVLITDLATAERLLAAGKAAEAVQGRGLRKAVRMR
jgi:hypothetical protein